MYLDRPPGPGARDRLSLRILQLGAVAIVLAATPYKAFDLDRYFVPKELVLVACAAVAAFIVVGRLARVSLTGVDVALVVFLVAGVASAARAPNAWYAERALAISTAGSVLFWAASSIRSLGLARRLLVALAVAVVLGAATSLAQAYGVRTEYFSLNRSPGGTFGNRNFVAHLCAIGGPVVVLTALTARRSWGALLGALGTMAIVAVLVLSRTRAAWLAALVSIVAIASAAIVSRGRWRGARTVRRLVLVGVAGAIGAVAAMVLPNTLEWKSGTPYLDSAVGLVNYRQGSGHGRLVQYTNSLRMTGDHPILGVGPGNWPVVYPRYASRNDPSMSQEDGTTANPWPSSDWIAYLSERGSLGLISVIVALVLLLRRALVDLTSAGHSAELPDSERVLMSIALIGTVVATVVVGSFDAVLIVAIPAYFVWTIAGALAPPSDRVIVAEPRLRTAAVLATLVLGGLAVLRSAGELAAIATFSESSHIAALARAATLDPGSYRIHLKLAQAYVARGECARARAPARAARALLPSAADPRRVLSSCGYR